MIAFTLLSYNISIALEVLALVCEVIVVEKPAHAGFSFLSIDATELRAYSACLS